MQDQLECKIVTPEFRANWVFLTEPGKLLDGSWAYSVEMIFEPGTDLSDMQQKMYNACVVALGPNQAAWPHLSSPLKQGNVQKPGDPVYAERIYARTKTNGKPGICDIYLNEIIDPNEIYSGMYARATIWPHVYTNKPGNGITFLLNNVMKVRDGDRLDNKASAQEDFAEYGQAQPATPNIFGPPQGGTPFTGGQGPGTGSGSGLLG